MIILCDMIDGEENLLKFQRLYANYKNTMYYVAYDIIKNPHDAEDIVEISLIKVIHMLSKIDTEDIDKSRGKNLMITITKNSALDYLDKKKHEPVPYKFIEDIGAGKNVEELYIETESYQAVVSYIDEMDDKYRDVLRLRILHRLSSKEAAKILNISEQNVNVRFMRAKAILAKRLGKQKKK